MFDASALIIALTVFVLAIFIGYEVITKVPPTLHTPLMSGSNAISGIVIVGALLVAGQADGLVVFEVIVGHNVPPAPWRQIEVAKCRDAGSRRAGPCPARWIEAPAALGRC